MNIFNISCPPALAVVQLGASATDIRKVAEILSLGKINMVLHQNILQLNINQIGWPGHKHLMLEPPQMRCLQCPIWSRCACNSSSKAKTRLQTGHGLATSAWILRRCTSRVFFWPNLLWQSSQVCCRWPRWTSRMWRRSLLEHDKTRWHTGHWTLLRWNKVKFHYHLNHELEFVGARYLSYIGQKTPTVCRC